MFTLIRKWWQDHKEMREEVKCAATNRMAEDYARYDDIDGVPYITVAGVPLFEITEHESNMAASTVSITDATIILLNIRQAYIDNGCMKTNTLQHIS